MDTPSTAPAQDERRGLPIRVLLISVLITTYVVSGWLGLRVAFVAEQVTTVWAPTGIAIAGLVLGGVRLWPAIWLGALFVNATTSAPLWTALLLATGNTLEAVIAALVLRRLSPFDAGFRRLGGVLVFIGIAVLASTMVSATIGTATLVAAGIQPSIRFAPVWFDWWLGDALGALVVAPPILTIAAGLPLPTRAWRRVLLFATGSVLLTHVVFGPVVGLGVHPLEYALFPLVVASAWVGGPPVSSMVVLASSAVTILDTIGGSGPFAGPEAHRDLVLLQAYTGVLATTALLLSAAITERNVAATRQRDSAAALRQRDELLRLAQRAGGIATFEWDFRREVANCSAEFFAMMGLSQDDGVMTGTEWAGLVHPDDRQQMQQHLERALTRGEPASADYRIVRADGELRWLHYAGRFEETAAGPRMLGTVTDITDRKLAEAALQDAKEAAESANRLKDQFLATLSHELRTPLNAILGYTRMLQTNVLAPDRRQRAIDIIERNATAQNQLIEDLLDISRITRGQVRLQPSPIGVASIVNEAIEGVRPAAEAKDITLHLDAPSETGLVMADPARLQQVFWNLLSNAVKFTERGGQVITRLQVVQNHVQVSVSDTGIGIPADFLPFVFEPFRQANSTTARSQGGLGLGLAISKQLVEMLGGTIRVTSAGAGSGATFTVSLPARAEANVSSTTFLTASPAPRGSEWSGGQPLTDVSVLLVDNDEESLTLFKDALEAAGARVHAATSAEEALASITTAAPDILITELSLPTLDGFGLLNRARATHPGIPTIAVTSYSRLDDRGRTQAAGFTAHVSKPIHPTELVRTMIAALSNGDPR